MEYISAKNLLCNAHTDDQSFIIFKCGKKYISVEIYIYAMRESSVCIWDTLNEMISGVTWRNWILNDTDDELKRKIYKKLNEMNNESSVD